jgi:hypothetical protein
MARHHAMDVYRIIAMITPEEDSVVRDLAAGAPSRAAWSRTVFPYALPMRFQFTLNQDTPKNRTRLDR